MAHTEFENRPWRQHRDFLVNGLTSSSVVSKVEALDNFHYVVQRPGKSELRIYLTNKYILSVTDVMEILEESPDTNCIVSTMEYNQYSPEAKEYCLRQGVGLFRTAELFGAIYQDGRRFLDYVRPDRNR
jgi:hypothetical protein